MSKWREFAFGGLLALALATAGCSHSPSSTDQPSGTSDTSTNTSTGGSIFHAPERVTIPEGTGLTVALDQTLSSAQNHSGDTFTATLIEPVVVDGKTVIPRDARVQGRVAEAVASGRLSGVAKLALTLDSVEIDGKNHAIETSEKVSVGKNHKTHDAEYIGGGAAVGALIGGLLGGGKGAAIGAGAGAGGGTAGAAATGKKDISLPAETRLTFALRKPLTVELKN